MVWGLIDIYRNLHNVPLVYFMTFNSLPTIAKGGVLHSVEQLIPLSHYRRHHPRQPPFGEMSLSLDHRLASVCKLESQ